MKPMRIITFDGGGICGLYSIVMLRRLLNEHPELLDKTTILAGTSTGGIIAMGLAADIPIDHLIDLYRRRGREIFHRPWHRRLLSPFGLRLSLYPNDGLVRVCHEVLGQTTIGSLDKKVIVPAFNLKSDASPEDPSWRMRFFHNLDDEDDDEKIADIAIRTASAPAYFPAYQGYIDGSVGCTDPSALAISQAICHYPGLRLSDIRVLSIGTGGQIKYVDGQNMCWGGIQWLRPILKILIGSQALVSIAQSEKLLDKRYHRLCPIIPDIALDAVSKTEDLVRLAEKADLTDALGFLENVFLPS